MTDAVGPTGPSPARGWSLERKLPLLIMALLGCVAGGLGAAAYREVRASAVARTAAHLERAARELATSSSRNSTPRIATLASLAADPLVVRAVTSPADGGPEAASALTARLDGSRTPTDTTLVRWELWAAGGERRLPSAAPLPARDSAVLAEVWERVRRVDSLQRSPLFGSEGAVRFWTVAPVRERGRVVGTLAELRRIVGSARTEQSVQQLIGEDVRLLFASAGSDEWASVRGTPAGAPFDRPAADDSATLVRGTDGGRWYVAQSAVPGSPWRIVLFQSEASVLRRPHEFLRTILVAGALLLTIGTLAAWVLSRHVTRPLRRITGAAEALAGGDYGQRVAVEGDAELASLAATFNTMAQRLGRAHAELAERNAALRRANEAKSRFLAVMSHELRTPLNAIGGYTELMELGVRGPVTPAQVADLGRIRRSKDHLLSIIKDILAFARADAGHLTLALADVRVAEVLTDATDALGQQFETKGVRLHVAPVPDTHVVRADREKLQQVVLNLLSNALRFTKPGGEVEVSTAPLDGGLRIDVRDTGIGIAPDRLQDIFEPFVQVDASLTRETGGTGLGLAISRDLTTAMGGRIGVESTPGEGSTFSVTLPTPGAAATSPAADRPARPGTPAAS